MDFNPYLDLEQDYYDEEQFKFSSYNLETFSFYPYFSDIVIPNSSLNPVSFLSVPLMSEKELFLNAVKKEDTTNLEFFLQKEEIYQDCDKCNLLTIIPARSSAFIKSVMKMKTLADELKGAILSIWIGTSHCLQVEKTEILQNISLNVATYVYFYSVFFKSLSFNQEKANLLLNNLDKASFIEAMRLLVISNDYKRFKKWSKSQPRERIKQIALFKELYSPSRTEVNLTVSEIIGSGKYYSIHLINALTQRKVIINGISTIVYDNDPNNHTIDEVDESEVQNWGSSAQNLTIQSNQMRPHTFRQTEIEEKTETTTVMPSPIQHPIQSQTRISAGIHSKYLDGRLPNLPQTAYAAIHPTLPNIDKNTILFEKMLSKDAFRLQPRKSFLIQTENFCATFHTDGQLPAKSTPATFILAGRGKEALMPKRSGGRLILVLTQQEYEQLQSHIPSAYDILVITKISHAEHGNYQTLGSPTARRLAIFLAAKFFFDLDSFMMIDDNIEKVTFSSDNLECQHNWGAFYQFGLKHASHLLCASVKTNSHKKNKTGELGSKIFILNMAKINTYIGQDINKIFALFPMAAQADYWGEDYYFQIGLHQIAQHPDKGYQIMSSDLAELTRSQKNKNAFAKTGKKATLFPTTQTHTEKTLINAIVHQLNSLINENQQRYQNQKTELINLDLEKVHAQVNQLEQTLSKKEKINPDFLPLVNLEEKNYFNRYQQLIKNLHFNSTIFRPYQIQALKKVSEFTGKKGRFFIATGAGKTYIQCELLRLAYHVAQEGEHIIVVTPQIDLVNQFYSDFIKFNKITNSCEHNLQIPSASIIKVSSDIQSCSLNLILLNQSLKKNIFIFCVDSFTKLLTEQNSIIKSPLIFLDEYHEYKKIVEQTDQHSHWAESVLIGSSATPPSKDLLASNEFSYSRAQGIKEHFLAPVIGDHLGMDYSEQNVKKLIQCLPAILSKHYHPGFQDKIESKVLKQLKGIIYLPSVELCEETVTLLKRHKIKAYSIHSKNNNAKKSIQDFLQSDEPGVLCAVRMLRIGFNDKKLAWAIIASNTKKPALIEQMIGRLMRLLLDKIGYVLTFKDIFERYINPILSTQSITFPVNVDYLSQESYYYCENDTIFSQDLVIEREKKNAAIEKNKTDVPSKVSAYIPQYNQKKIAYSHKRTREEHTKSEPLITKKRRTIIKESPLFIPKNKTIRKTEVQISPLKPNLSKQSNPSSHKETGFTIIPRKISASKFDIKQNNILDISRDDEINNTNISENSELLFRFFGVYNPEFKQAAEKNDPKVLKVMKECTKNIFDYL